MSGRHAGFPRGCQEDGMMVPALGLSDGTTNFFNTQRKLYHILGLVVPGFFYLEDFASVRETLPFPVRFTGLVLLGLALLLLLAIDIGRFTMPRFNAFFFRLLGPLLKSEEKDRFNATVPYFLSAFVLFMFFPRNIAICACILLMIGDPAAAYFGGNFGRRRLSNGKSLVGVVAFVVAGYSACMLFLFFQNYPMESTDIALQRNGIFQISAVLIALLGSISAAGAELFSTTGLKGILDDNLIVPLSAGSTMAVSVYLLGFVSQ